MSDKEKKNANNKSMSDKPPELRTGGRDERFANMRQFSPSRENGGERSRGAMHLDTSMSDEPRQKKAAHTQREEANLDSREDGSGKEAKRRRQGNLHADNGRVIGEIKSKKSKKRKKSRSKRLAIICLIIASAAAVASLLYFLLRIQYIYVEGNSEITAEEIVELSGIETGMHTWFISTLRAANAIMEEPYIASAKITREYPDALRISVVERKAAVVIVGVSSYAVIDNEGYVLSIDAGGKYDDILKVTGMGASGYQVGTYLGDENDFMARTLLEIMKSIEESGIVEEIKSIDISNPMSIEMETAAGMTVHMGQSDNAEAKMKKLAQVLPWLREHGHTSGTIDVSVQGDPVFSPQATPTPPSASAEPSPTFTPPAVTIAPTSTPGSN